MMKEIQSSMLSHIGWADDTLFVRYHPTKAQAAAGEQGTLWAYKNYVHGVPKQQPEEGWGKWFNANVKKLYTGEKVDPVTLGEMPPIPGMENMEPWRPNEWMNGSAGSGMTLPEDVRPADPV